MTNAVNMVDMWTLGIGRYLRSYPLTRIAFVAYLISLHVWVFFVLAMHTHNLEGTELQEPGNFVTNKVHLPVNRNA